MSWLKSFWQPLFTPKPGEYMRNFTPRSQQVLALAREEATRLNHNFIGTEHLLLGLIKLGQGTGVAVLSKMGLTLDDVRREVEQQILPGHDEKPVGNIPYTPRVKKVLALAAKESKALNHTYVGTEHILLGLLREGDGVASRVLKNLIPTIHLHRRRMPCHKSQNPPNANPLISRGDTTCTVGQESTKSYIATLFSKA